MFCMSRSAEHTSVCTITPSDMTFHRLHIDYPQKRNSNFLVIIDSYSKWLEMFETRNASLECTCDNLRTLFTSFGLPEEVVSDNGLQFTSSVFKLFLTNNGVKLNTNSSVPPCIKRCSRTIDLYRF